MCHIQSVLLLFTELAARCCQEAGIRYYRILQNHVGEEKIRLGLSDISVSLLPPCGHCWNGCLTNPQTMSDVQFLLALLCVVLEPFILTLFMCSPQHHLGNDLFHLCLVACCLEIAIFSNRLPCVFPMLLQILGLAPYHFWRVRLYAWLCELSSIASLKFVLNVWGDVRGGWKRYKWTLVAIISWYSLSRKHVYIPAKAKLRS